MMAKFTKKRVTIDATQWFKNGDHPRDGEERFESGVYKGEKYEGKVVRYFRRPDMPGIQPCRHCQQTMHVHGWIDTKEGGHIVCPGDWIITGVAGEVYPCKPDIFNASYDPGEPPSDPPVDPPKKVTIAELEAILNEPAKKVTINPDGTVTVHES